MLTPGDNEREEKMHFKELEIERRCLLTVPHGTEVIMYQETVGADGNHKYHHSVTDADGCYSIGTEEWKRDCHDLDDIQCTSPGYVQLSTRRSTRIHSLTKVTR